MKCRLTQSTKTESQQVENYCCKTVKSATQQDKKCPNETLHNPKGVGGEKQSDKNVLCNNEKGRLLEKKTKCSPTR